MFNEVLSAVALVAAALTAGEARATRQADPDQGKAALTCALQEVPQRPVLMHPNDLILVSDTPAPGSSC